jgi:hypothetical protein
VKRTIVYFEHAGNANTDATLRLAKARAVELGITHVALASSSGRTAQQALNVFQDTAIHLYVVGTSRPSFHQDILTTLETKGIPVRFSSEVEYAYPDSVRNAFRKLSEGMKVVMDLGMILRDEDLVAANDEIVAIGGTGPLGYAAGGGVDTAVVMIPRRSHVFHHLPDDKDQRRDIKEIICKPR